MTKLLVGIEQAFRRDILPTPIVKIGPMAHHLVCEYCPHPLAWHSREEGIVEVSVGELVVGTTVTERITRCRGCAAEMGISIEAHGGMAPACLIIKVNEDVT